MRNARIGLLVLVAFMSVLSFVALAQQKQLQAPTTTTTRRCSGDLEPFESQSECQTNCQGYCNTLAAKAGNTGCAPVARCVDGDGNGCWTCTCDYNCDIPTF